MKTQSRASLMAVSFIAILTLILFNCNKSSGGSPNPPTPNPPTPPVVPPVQSDMSLYLTNADQSALFQKQNITLAFSSTIAPANTISVDTTQIFQQMDGFGYTLTGGSATLIHSLPSNTQESLLKDLFLWDSTFIGVSYLRISIGASDLSATTFTYNDLPAGQTDPNMDQFNIDKEKTDLIPVLKKILALNPSIKILGSPWTAPLWMKTNNAFIGGKLKPEWYAAYAKYFVKYIQAMKAEGITIDAITPQNEPLHGGNNPSMEMLASEQAAFIRDHLGPAFQAAGLNTKIIIYDHNADRPDYPLDVLGDAAARPYIYGSAFHLYAGNINALTQVHDAYPDKHVYFTEQWVGGPSNFGGDLGWHIENLIIGATRNWSKTVLEWNLASDPNYRPYTPGGCSNCLGALTVTSTYSRNVAYYIIAHASKFVRPGSVRIYSNHIGPLLSVAFKNPEGKKVLIVLNKGNQSETFNIKFNDKAVSTTLRSGSVGTYVW